MYYQELLNSLTSASKAVFGGSLTGVYLHGSLAMGCFNPAASDIDVIVVINSGITDGQKLEYLRQIVLLNGHAPAKGIELSVVKREYCKPFVYPTPYELHFSPAHLERYRKDAHEYVAAMKGVDIDLAAHFTVISRYGVVLYGEPIAEVFGAVPAADYFDSIWHDIENAEAEIVSNPVYIILNLCRVLAFLKENLCTSKKAGGEWGLKNLPKDFSPLVEQALACYNSGGSMSADPGAARDFARFMLKEIELHKPRN